MFENFLLSLKKWFIKSFSRNNIFNSCIENICISICIKWITAKKKSYLIKTSSQRCRRLLSMFFMVLRRLCLSVIYMGQWRRKCAVDSISKPQLHNAFKESWKLCLNLCSRKWLKQSRSLMISLIPLGLWQLKRLLQMAW